jgi:hypothetical protein
VWEGLRRNANINVAPDTSSNPVHGYSNMNLERIEDIRMFAFDEHENVGFGSLSISGTSCYTIPHGGKINLKSPFAFSFWAKHIKPDYPWNKSDTGIRFIAFGYNSNPYEFNGFRIITGSDTDLRIMPEFLAGASTSTHRRLQGDVNDERFKINSEVWKHVFVYYDNTNLGMVIDNQHTITKAGSNLLNYNVTNDSDFYIGGQRNSISNTTSWRGNAVYMRDLRWYNGYIPNQSERTQLYNHGLLSL